MGVTVLGVAETARNDRRLDLTIGKYIEPLKAEEVSAGEGNAGWIRESQDSLGLVFQC